MDPTDDDNDDDNNENEVRVEDVPGNKDDDHTPHENGENQVEEPIINEEHGCGMLIR